MAGRLTTEAVQVLTDGGTSKARLTTEAVQVLTDGGPSSARLTSEVFQIMAAVSSGSNGGMFRVMGFIG